MTKLSKKSWISMGFFRTSSALRSWFLDCLDSSATILWACSMQRSQIWASRPAINRLVSGFFLPQKEHSKFSFAILHQYSVFDPLETKIMDLVRAKQWIL